MKFSFHPEAEKELNQAIDYYEEIDPGLGIDFAMVPNQAKLIKLEEGPKKNESNSLHNPRM